jgi:tRNA(fMet)-specific endonuclease VapC
MQDRSDIALSAIVRSELLTGALLSAKPAENRQQVETFCALFVCLPFDAEAANTHANLHAHLRRAGTMIGAHDLMIAATTLTHDLTVITHNVGEFSRIDALKVEDWQD